MPRWLPLHRFAPTTGRDRRLRAPGRPWGPAHRLGAVTGVVLAISGLAVHGAGGTPEPALAQVHHAAGFHATVLGWTSWYGSYGMGDLGHGWCIDHGLRAPDPALGYVRTPVTDASPDTRAAISWAVTTRSGTDPVEAAAVMLVLHDLMGARYPFGVLHVDRLSPANLAGFGGREGQVLERARLIKADALAHRHLRGPFALTLTASPGAPLGTAGPGRLVARLVDVHGAPVVGAPVVLRGTGAEVAPAGARTGADGTVAAGFTGGDRPATFAALAAIPDPALTAFAATRAAAQRIARPAVVAVAAETALAPPTTTTRPPTTTTTRPPTTTAPPTTTTTTTRPPTTTTTAPPSTTTTSSTTPPTTRPPATTTAPTTTAPTTTAPTTTTPPPPPTVTTSTAAPPDTTVPAPPDQTPPDQSPPALTSSPPVVTPPTPGGVLPRTGAQVAGLALTGLGLVLLGLATVGARRAWRPGRPEHAGRTPRLAHDGTRARDAGGRR